MKMGEEAEDQIKDVDITNSDSVFDNLTILKEFSNIANLVRNEDFLETVPKAKLRRVKWVPMFNFLKQGIVDEMIHDMNEMWKYENLQKKLELLEKQKEKSTDIAEDKVLWRPQVGDVKAQLKASDVSSLQKQKILLESLAKEYDGRVNRLKKTISAKRGYLKALQLDIQKYQKKNEDYILKLNEKIENHQNLINAMLPMRQEIEDINWIEKDILIKKK